MEMGGISKMSEMDILRLWKLFVCCSIVWVGPPQFLGKICNLSSCQYCYEYDSKRNFFPVIISNTCFFPAIISKSDSFPAIISENHKRIQRTEVEYLNLALLFHFLGYQSYMLPKNVGDAGNDFLFSAQLFQIYRISWNGTCQKIRSIQNLSSKNFSQVGPVELWKNKTTGQFSIIHWNGRSIRFPVSLNP